MNNPIVILKTTESQSAVVSADLAILKERIYDKCGYILTNFKRSPESQEYDACSFVLEGRLVQYRASKITPTKVGQFVTTWKRNSDGVTEPFNISDEVEFIFITSKRTGELGQFIFPKSVLIERGVLSRNGKEGKRGIRVYPPWDQPTNSLAVKTQSWQTKYFISLNSNETVYLKTLKALFA
ncbi:MAG: MepB family protein [Chryseolinea sp.]